MSIRTESISWLSSKKIQILFVISRRKHWSTHTSCERPHKIQHHRATRTTASALINSFFAGNIIFRWKTSKPIDITFEGSHTLKLFIFPANLLISSERFVDGDSLFFYFILLVYANSYLFSTIFLCVLCITTTLFPPPLVVGHTCISRPIIDFLDVFRISTVFSTDFW